MDGSIEKDLNNEDLINEDLNSAKVSRSEKNARGGRRQGAGRPKAYSKLYTFRAPKELVPVIDAQPSKSDFFKECISRAVADSNAAGVAFGQLQQSGEQGQSGELGQLEQQLAQQFGRVEQLSEQQLAQQFGRVEQLSEQQLAQQFGQVVPAERVRPLSLPFFDIGIVAGFPIPLDNDERAQDIELLRMLCPNPESSYLIRVEGDSMIDAGIFSGDIVIVDKSNRNPSESQVAVCEFNGEYTLKRFVQRDGAGWLVPANPDYPEIRVTPDDSFSVWGTVTYIIHKPRS